MSLLKIPGIIVATAFELVSTTPPNPSPNQTEIRTPTFVDRYLRQRAVRPLRQLSFSSLALAELAVILAHNYRNFRISSIILSILVFDRDPNRIRITPSFVLGCLFIVSGTLIRVYCFRRLGTLFTFGITVRKDHRLVTDGPYRFVRHPSYTGSMMCYTGLLLWLLTEGSWIRECGVLSSSIGKVFTLAFVLQIAVIAYGLLARMSKEDELLKKEFGKDWEAWASKVPYRLIPGLF